MDYSAAKFWLEVVIMFGMIGNAVYTWVSSKQAANRSEIEAVKTEFATALNEFRVAMTKMDERAVALKLRVTEVESDLRHLPTETALSDLAVQFKGLHGDFKALTAELKGMRDMQDVMRSHTQLIDEFLRANR